MPASTSEETVAESPAAPTPASTPTPRPTPPARSTVVAVHDASVVERYSVNPARVRVMVDRLVAAVTDQPDAAHGWRSLVSPNDIVGIKIAAARGAAAPTRRAVVLAVVESLIASGHPRDRILVWDRDPDELRLAGFLPERGSSESVFACPVAFIEPRVGYDPKATYVAPVLGKLIWGDLLFQGTQSPLTASVALLHQNDPSPTPAENNAGASSPAAAGASSRGNHRAPAAAPDNLSDTSHLCNILSKRVTKIINLPTLCDSVFAGVAGALYNVTIPDIDNWRRLSGEPRWGNPYIVDLYSDPRVGGRVVLNIMDGLIAQYAGGPSFQPLYARHHATLYASRDPVAIDAQAVRYLELWRAQRGLPPLGKATDHVRTAAESGLGNQAAEKIDLRNVAP
ncbi:MAG: DUF362 domain-containing protein [Verrucomicrobia bacterium]|nr:DUF362 domain-containing protein [Verrucomicrobiota bacterium]